MNVYHKGTNSQSSHSCLSSSLYAFHANTLPYTTPFPTQASSPHQTVSRSTPHVDEACTSHHTTSHHITSQHITNITSLYSTAQHSTAQDGKLQATGGALPAHTTHNSLLLALENITEYSVGRGCKRFGVLALMLQPTAPTRHVNYHETVALCTVHMYVCSGCAGGFLHIRTFRHNCSTHSILPIYIPRC